MSTTPILMVPVSTEMQVDPGQMRAQQPVSKPILGSDSTGENPGSQTQPSRSSSAQDEVKVQWEPPGEIAVYRFLDQNGTLVLQVPPQQRLNLAEEISQKLAKEAAPKPVAGMEGGKENGH
jgi:hypothetical protein